MQVDGKEVELKPVRGKHTKRLIKHMAAMLKEDEVQADALMEYALVRDGIASEISGMTIEELDELPVSEKVKITSLVEDAAKEEWGFMRPSK